MYLFTVLLFTFFALLETANPKLIQKYKFVFAFIAFSFLIVHDGLRWETGSDWMAYLNFYNDIDTMRAGDVYFEPGYFYLMQSVRFLSDDYTAYLLVHAFIFYSCIFYTIFKLSNAPFLSILLLYMVTLPFLGMNRQFLAMAIAMLGFVFLVRRQAWVFVALVLFAMLFHKSVACCLVMPLLMRRYNSVFLIVLLIGAIGIAFTGIVNTFAPALSLLMLDANRTDGYMEAVKEFSPISFVVSLSRKLIWIVLLMYYDKAIEGKTRSYTFFFNVYFVSILVYIVCSGTMLQSVVSRMLIYFNIAEIFILPYLLTVFKPLRDKIILIFLFGVYTFISIQKGILNYGEGKDFFTPYKGLFINANYVKYDVHQLE